MIGAPGPVSRPAASRCHLGEIMLWSAVLQLVDFLLDLVVAQAR